MKIQSLFILICILLLNCTTTTTTNENTGNKEIKNSKTTVSPPKTDLNAFFNRYGGKANFQTHYIDAITTMITVEDLVKENKYQTAKIALNKLWQKYPVGENIWWDTKADDKKNQTNLGRPPAYSALRMLTNIVDYQLNNPQSPSEVLTSTLRVVLVGCSEGKNPSTVTEMKNGTGRKTTKIIDARLKADNHQIIDQSLDLFLRYVNAMTNGRLKVEVKYYDLENYCASTKVSKDGKYANLKNYGEVLNQIPQNIKQETDWWWILYPSAVPEDGINGIAPNAGFDKNYEFITGGMGAYGQNEPTFIIDDRWLVRCPPHLGHGKMSDIERRAYLPQWLQHEFFHHLYRSYPKLQLEVKGHDWFDRTFWAKDFKGTFEADYYHETLHKRLKTAKPALHYTLNPTYQPTNRVLNNLKISQFLNQTFDASEMVKARGIEVNDWHIAQIIQEGNKYYWKNKAGAKWEVVPDFQNNRLKTKDDNPYKGHHFFISFKKDENGGFTNTIEGLDFNGTIYKLR